MSSTGNWKNAERVFADIYNKFKIEAYRKTRAGNFSVSDYDVEIVGEPRFKNDSKYTKKAPFRHHGKWREIKEKYCKEKEDIPILFTKNAREHFGLVSVDARFFAMLLSYWLGKATKEELESIYYNG